MINKLEKGIVIVTCGANKEFLADCINSCYQKKYPILIVSNGGYKPFFDIDVYKKTSDVFVNDWNGFELGGIVRGMEFFDEFILLHDTVVVKDQSIFDISFDYPGAVFYTEDLRYHYAAKYRTKILKQMNIPRVETVRAAIDIEQQFGKDYLDKEKESEVQPLGLKPFMPCGNFGDPIVERHGSKGIIVSNPWMEKFKRNY